MLHCVYCNADVPDTGTVALVCDDCTTRIQVANLKHAIRICPPGYQVVPVPANQEQN
jgi:tRNA(Ile2) C34 agmatinyltransferase TiaS